jgi:hypothetical protein
MKLRDFIDKVTSLDLTDANCVVVVIVIDFVLAALIVFLGAETLIRVQTGLRWSGLFIQLAGLVFGVRGWSLLSRYRQAVTGRVPWWDFDRAIECLR